MLIGWVLSIYWGYLIVMKAMGNQGMQNNMMSGKIGSNYASQQNNANMGGQEFNAGINNRTNIAQMNNPNMGGQQFEQY